MNFMKTILVVDDEPAILDLVCRMLRQAAFDVCGADDLEQARRRLCFAPGIDAVLCDYDLPDGTGLDLLAWLHDHDGGSTPVVIMSGLCFSSCSQGSLAGFEFLAKPFSSVDLLSALDRAFQNAPQPALRSEVWAAPAPASNIAFRSFSSPHEQHTDRPASSSRPGASRT